jgi:hypothetical protein
MAFDLLAVNAVDIRSQRWSTRRGRLESPAVWEPPLQLTPINRSVEDAQEWMEVLPAAMASRVSSPRRLEPLPAGAAGVAEGQAPRPAATATSTATTARSWSRSAAPCRLRPAQAKELAAVLTPAGSGHPWPDVSRTESETQADLAQRYRDWLEAA